MYLRNCSSAQKTSREKVEEMAILGKSEGIFNINESDKTVGSYLIKEDIAAILSISIKDLAEIEFEVINGLNVIDEIRLIKIWNENKIPNAIPLKNTSFDELILKSLARITYPKCNILPQEKIGRYRMDLKISVNGITKYIEFDGPYHFAETWRYGRPKKHPFDKKKHI